MFSTHYEAKCLLTDHRMKESSVFLQTSIRLKLILDIDGHLTLKYLDMDSKNKEGTFSKKLQSFKGALKDKISRTYDF